MSWTRRRFLGFATAAGWSAACSQEAVPPPPLAVETPEEGMRLAMSVRVAESFFNKRESSMAIDELVAVAKAEGYSALCMRASTAGIHSPEDVIEEYSQKIRDAGLQVSMVTGDFVVPMNNDDGPNGLRDITPYLDLAQAFGAPLIRVCMKKDEDIPFAQQAADEAAERDIRLAHQSHCASLFETVDGSLDVLERVGRPNFGIIYEPANWFVAGEDYGPETIRRLEPYIFNVYVQNHRLNPEAEAKLTTWKKGPVGVDHIGIWEEDGVAFEPVFATLREIGYGGYVTVHQAFEGIMTVDEAVGRSAEYLRTVIA